MEHGIDANLIEEIAAVQDDTLLASLSPYETLTYVARLRLPTSWTK